MAEFDNLYAHGFVRVAAASPRVHLADPASNARETIDLMRKADKAGAAVCIFPELGLSGYTIDDLHMQSTLLAAVREAIARVKHASKSLAPVVVVGAPIQIGDPRAIGVFSPCERNQRQRERPACIRSWRGSSASCCCSAPRA